MAEPRFTHLHVHTHYSLLDGACKVSSLVKQVKALGMDSIAITDHGCLFGVIEFYNECKKEGIKPILGMEAYMAPGARTDKSTPGGHAGEAAYHLVLLAETIEGYHNLIRLGSIAYREGFYYKPRIDKDILRQLKGGLIATSACLGGEIPTFLLKRDPKAARRVAETYLEIFGPERFFIEIQKQGIKEQDEVNPELVELAKQVGCGIVGTNDVHFLKKDDHYAHDVLCCVSMAKNITDEGRLKYPQGLYLKSPREMAEGLGQWPESIDNTVRIAAMCNVELDFSKRFAPVYKVPVEKLLVPSPEHAKLKADEQYLRQLCEEGLIWRYETKEVGEDIRKRLDYELKIIAMKHFCSYFLIVWDFCNYARDNGIPVGARGSGVGTMVGYLLGLCNVDPLKYGLLFERFMDPSRNEMPDIDIDICQNGRQKIIEYVRQKYGHVAQIITFGTMAAKAACKDVGRVLGVTLAEVDKLTKLIPGTPGMTLDKAMKSVPDLERLYHENPTIHNVIDIARKLEGLNRNAGVHAAGVIIADQPLDEVIPLCKDKDGNVLTQFEGPISEKCGLLKMDFLGLRTLTTLQRSIDLVKQTKGIEIDIEKIDFADKTVLSLFCRGETKGIFQFESGGMQDLLIKMQPDRVEDLIAANALYRPGPMELIPSYCSRKNGKEAVPKVHPVMDEILAETYGIMVYQEQVMQIFNQLGGIELSNAYKLIKAISKKTIDVIHKFQPQFIKGTMDKGVDQAKAEEIFEHILKFGGYGFNKSHSSRYAIVAFQTAYMKAYHPVEYMSALLTFEMGDTDKVVEYIEECRKLRLPDGTRGVKVLPPDVNVSDKDFTPVYGDQVGDRGQGTGKTKGGKKKMEGTIRFGMMAVRGVGEKAVEAVIEERKKKGEFRSLYEFCERVDLRTVTKSTIEALIKCGAYTSLGGNRAQLLAIMEKAVEMGQQAQADKRSGQLSMFGGDMVQQSRMVLPDTLPQIDELQKPELLKFEKELLGFYITSHPLTDQQHVIERYTTASTRDVMQISEGVEVMVGGMIARVKKSIVKSGRSAGQTMAFITLEDLEGQIDAVLFSDLYAEITQKYPNAMEAESIIFLKGKVDRKKETPGLIVNELIPLEQAISRLSTGVVIKLERMSASAEEMNQIKLVLKKHHGNTPVFIQTPYNGSQMVTIRTSPDFSVRITPQLLSDLELAAGHGNAILVGAGTKRRRLQQQQQLFQESIVESEPKPVVEVDMLDMVELEEGG